MTYYVCFTSRIFSHQKKEFSFTQCTSKICHHLSRFHILSSRVLFSISLMDPPTLAFADCLVVIKGTNDAGRKFPLVMEELVTLDVARNGKQ